MQAGELEHVLMIVREASNLSDDSFDDLRQTVRYRLAACAWTTNAVEGSTTPDVSEPPTQSQIPSFCGQAEFARILGLPAINVRMWRQRGKLPQPTDYVGNRPVWSRRVVREFCRELTVLRNAQS